MNNWFQIRSDQPTRWFRSRMINFNQAASWNSDGDRIQSWQNVNAHVVFANNWQIGGGYNVNEASVDDRVTRGGPAAIVEGYREAGTGEQRQPPRAVARLQRRRRRRRPRVVVADVEPGATWRPDALATIRPPSTTTGTSSTRSG